jgi:hypothetical protein
MLIYLNRKQNVSIFLFFHTHKKIDLYLIKSHNTIHNSMPWIQGTTIGKKATRNEYLLWCKQHEFSPQNAHHRSKFAGKKAKSIGNIENI